MIHIKIYGKGKDRTHCWCKINCRTQDKSAEVSALLLTVCDIMRSASGDNMSRDKFLEAIGKAWDYKEDNDEQKGD